MSKLQNLENSPLALAPASGTAALPLKVDVQDISGCTCGSRAQNEGNDCVLAPFHAPVCALRVPVPVPSRSPETHTPPSGVSGPNVLGSNAVERLVPTAGSAGTCCLWCSRLPLQDGVAGACLPADAKSIYSKGMSSTGPPLSIVGIGGDSPRVGAAGLEPEFCAPTHGPLTAAGSNGLLSVSSRVAMFAPPAMPTVLICVALLVLLAQLLTAVLARLGSSRLCGRSVMVLKGLRTRLCPSFCLPRTRYCLGNIAAPSVLDAIAGNYARTATTGNRRPTRSGRNLVSTSTAWSGRLRDRDPPPARSDGSVDRAGAQTAVRNPVHGRNDVVKIMYWNIHHDFTLKLTDEEFQDILKSYDIMFLAETDMLPGEDDAADVPPVLSDEEAVLLF
ncbi:hypothetical protein C8R46DRAFT_1287073 [Mycena filopes]|nr:hypothetical protein C8R46DRAFT_1287073 [Mycena filopes]